MAIDQTGAWSSLLDWPLIGLHSVVTPDGKVLTYGTNPAKQYTRMMEHDVWNPVTGQHQLIDHSMHTPTEIFCSAAAIIPGTTKILIAGGDALTAVGAPTNMGVKDVNVYDVATGHIMPATEGDMVSARWYGTVTALPSGQLIAIGGQNQFGQTATVPDIFTLGEGWRPLTGAKDMDLSAWYPKTFVGNDGNVYYFGNGNGADSIQQLYQLDTKGEGSIKAVANMPFEGNWSMPAVMYEPNKALISDVNKGLWVMDLNGPTPTFTKVGETSQLRVNGCMTVLADGKVLMTGGAAYGQVSSTADKTATIWDPKTNTLTETVDEINPRLYHSTAVLLADGSILSTGGQGDDGAHLDAQIYKPGYLFNADGSAATRPVVSNAPQSVDPGQIFTIDVTDAASIKDVTFVRNGSSTHNFNPETRAMHLEFSVVDSNTLSVKVPANISAINPGSWMLFAWNSEGTPSVAPIISVEPDRMLGVEPVGTNMLVNGDMMLNQFTNTFFETYDNDGVAGWSNAAEDALEVVKVGGKQTLDLDVHGAADEIFQDVLTRAGKVYELKFDIVDAPKNTSAFDVLWNGSVVKAFADPVAGTFSILVTGTGNVDKVSFRELASQNDSWGAKLGNVSLVDTGKTGVTPPAAGELIVNGNFEAGATGPGTAGDGWTLTGTGGVDNTAARAANGDKYFALDGWANAHDGVLSQTINTAVGQTYTLKLKAAVTGPATSDAQLKLEALNGATAVETKLVSVKNGMAEYSMSFTATSAQTTIKLSDASPKGQANFDIDIDVVSVLAGGTVTPPETGHDHNLLSNASFETANGAKPDNYAILHNGDVGAWQSSTNQIEVWNNGFYGVAGTDGKNVVEIDANNGTLSQSVKTEAGKFYGLSFDFAGRPGAIASSKMEVLWNGAVIGTVTPDSSTMKSYHFHATGTGGNDVLAFRPVAGDLDNMGGLLDHVELTVSSHPPAGGLNMIQADAAGGYYPGTDGADHFMGAGGNDTFYAAKGDDIVDGAGGDYNQVDLDGAADDWTFTKNADGSIKAVSATYGTKTLTEIDGVFFYGSGKWASMTDLVTIPAGSVNTITGDADGGYYVGTSGVDHFIGGAGNDTFVGREGNDIYDGGAGYNQIDLAGSIASWDFSKNADGSVTAHHATQGTDTLHDIGGVWFQDANEWQSIDSLVG